MTKQAALFNMGVPAQADLPGPPDVGRRGFAPVVATVCVRIGAAGEWLVGYRLTRMGYHVSSAPPGLPFDLIVVDDTGRVARIQVKTCSRARNQGKTIAVYRFSLRYARIREWKDRRRYDLHMADFYAFAFLDTEKVAFLPATALLAADGAVKETVDWRPASARVTRDRRGHTVPHEKQVRIVEDHAVFPW